MALVLERRAEHADQLTDAFGGRLVERAHRQHLSRWLHILQRQSSGLVVMRSKSSPARVAWMIVTARSLALCADAASNGTRKCRRSQVSAFRTVNSAAFGTSR